MSGARLSNPYFMSSTDGSIMHLNLDDAWEISAAELPTVDLRQWGPHLRFSAPTREIERFAAERAPNLAPFLVYGSGDFHHLTAIWLRRLSRLTTVISFDNHPDWDIRPPKWACGAWVNRALELPQVDRVSVWGCGNFECWWPMRIFGNNLAEKSGRLEVHPWADGRRPKDRKRPGAILRGNWRDHFERFVRQLAGEEVYVTIDLDCLAIEEAVTNWESGRFTVDEVNWAVDLLGKTCRIVAGDICGAWSIPRYARRKQPFVSEMDHPKIILPPTPEIQRRNQNALGRLLPVLSHRNQDHTQTDHDRADR
jgi:arginase family enzyme